MNDFEFRFIVTGITYKKARLLWSLILSIVSTVTAKGRVVGGFYAVKAKENKS